MKRTILFHVCGLLLACGCGWMTWCSFWIAPHAVANEVYVFLSVIFFMSIVYAVAAYGTSTGWLQPSCKSVILWALVFRAVLFPSLPILETDWNRYLWDGFVSSQGMNPYQYPPALFLDTQAIHDLPEAEREAIYALMEKVRHNERSLAVLQDINNATVNTVYPPMAQWLFMMAAAVQPFSLLVWRCIILCFDGLLLYGIVRLLELWNRNPAMVIFYAWSPLVLKEYINTTHFDGVALSLLFIAILLGCQKRIYRSSIAWSAAVMTKFFPIAVLLFWIPIKQWKTWRFFLTAFLIICVPFIPATTSGYTGYAHFAQRWESNSSLVSMMEWGYQSNGVPAWNEGIVFAQWEGVPFTFDAFMAAKLSGLLMVGLIFLYLMMRLNDDQNLQDINRMNSTFIMIGAVILCSPVANPWYIAWITPFLCFYPMQSWFYLSIACFLYYLFFTGERIGYIPLIREVEFIPFYLLLLYELTYQRYKQQDDKTIESDKT